MNEAIEYLARKITSGGTLEKRIDACNQAGEENHVALIPTLGRLTRAKEWELRYAASQALSAIADEKAIPHLINYLKDTRPEVREATTSALIKRSKQATPHLIKLLRQGGRFTRVAAANILAELKEEQAVLPLISQLGHCDRGTVFAMSQALADINGAALASIFPGIFTKEKTSISTAHQLLKDGDFRFITPLVRYLKMCRHSPHHEEIHDVLKDLQSTAVKYGEQMICMTHLRRFIKRQFISNLFPFQLTPYMACRTCRSTLSGRKIKTVVVNLDHEAPEMSWGAEEQLLINWFIKGEVFDFNAVRIANATDQEVMQFCLTAGNDSDRFRRKRYKSVSCHVLPSSGIQTNTLRILKQTFGTVHTDSAP